MQYCTDYTMIVLVSVRVWVFMSEILNTVIAVQSVIPVTISFCLIFIKLPYTHASQD